MSKRVAVIGAGPVGIEAALLLSQRGFDVTVFEAGVLGAHVRRWSHVRFFSPWSLNRSSWGAAALRAAGLELAGDSEFPSGAEYLQDYLRPLSESGPLERRIRTSTRVVGITRRDAWKGDHIGRAERRDSPFLLAVDGLRGREWVEADVVLDASGTYGNPNALGPGGLAACGEDDVAERIERWIPEPLERDRARYADRTTLLIGEGHSAATTMELFVRLRQSASATRVLWLRRSERPYQVLPDDVLPQRRRLSELGNAAARGEVDGVEPLGIGRVVEFLRDDDRVRVTWERGDGDRFEVAVDEVVSNVGYRPEMELSRELQVHHCWASEGPMKLAASLLAQAGNADCLAQNAAGVELLRNPEPNFYVLGSKSYGRNSNFLLRVGFEQIEAIAEELPS